MIKAFTRHHAQKVIFSLFRLAFLLGLCFIILYPILLKLAISFRSYEDIMDSSIIFLPKHFSWKSLLDALKTMNYKKTFISTLIISGICSLLHVISCTITAYSLGKFNFIGKKIFYLFVIIAFLVPPKLISVPMYAVFKNFNFLGLLSPFFPHGINLLDRPISLFMLYGTANALKSGLYIYLMIQFFRNLPKELNEAASVDGAGPFRTLIYIALPSAKIMMITVFLFTFVWQWTDLEYTSMYLLSYPVLSTELYKLSSTFFMNMLSTDPVTPIQISQIISSGSIVFMVPLLVLYLICNRFFVQGIERSGIVG